MKVGVLALQGAFREHREVLEALGADAVDVRTPDDLPGCDGIVLPGGESTTIAKLLVSSGLLTPVRDRIRDGIPTLATCAGLILVAHEIVNREIVTREIVTREIGARVVGDARPDPGDLDVLDVTVRRNAYGSQSQSFEAPLDVAVLGPDPFPGVFIRAPVIDAVGGGVEVLAEHDTHPVLVRAGGIWAATFHPELSGDLRLHQRFLEEVP